ncbi:hypothetical protein BDW22DRAFT_1427363 [Trametopsis cervina]|nr:hypothetical protein BDW22DRAFT_1427363 [Trametopsis cervina]
MGEDGLKAQAEQTSQYPRSRLHLCTALRPILMPVTRSMARMGRQTVRRAVTHRTSRYVTATTESAKYAHSSNGVDATQRDIETHPLFPDLRKTWHTAVDRLFGWRHHHRGEYINFPEGTPTMERITKVCQRAGVDTSILQPITCLIPKGSGYEKALFCFPCLYQGPGKEVVSFTVTRTRAAKGHSGTDGHKRIVAKLLGVETACLNNLSACPVTGCTFKACIERTHTMRLHMQDVHPTARENVSRTHETGSPHLSVAPIRSQTSEVLGTTASPSLSPLSSLPSIPSRSPSPVDIPAPSLPNMYQQYNWWDNYYPMVGTSQQLFWPEPPVFVNRQYPPPFADQYAPPELPTAESNVEYSFISQTDIDNQWRGSLSPSLEIIQMPFDPSMWPM